jgi:hypothetical protein
MEGRAVNRTMDRDDLHLPECGEILLEVFALMRRMKRRGASYSSWYGAVDAWPGAWEHINRGASYQPWPGNPDEINVPWFLLWEIAWLVAHTPLRPGQRVLDMGGAGSLFSCYLASRGCEVHAIDLDERLCRRARQTASLMRWPLHAERMDMTRLAYPDGFFDHVFSVCVFEHLPVSGRVACNRDVARVLADHGTAAYTFDYANPQSFGRLDTPDDVIAQFVEPSGMVLSGGSSFVDNGRRYLEAPQCFGFGRFIRAAACIHAAVTGTVSPLRALTGATSYTMGAVFLEKPPSHRVAAGPQVRPI